MSAPSRRKAKNQVLTFSLTVEAQEMLVEYQPDWMEGTGQFTFRSPHNPPRRIPVSETGSRSDFADMEDIASYPSPQDYARDFVLSMLRSSHDQRQPMFSKARAPAGAPGRGFRASSREAMRCSILSAERPVVTS